MKKIVSVSQRPKIAYNFGSFTDLKELKAHLESLPNPYSDRESALQFVNSERTQQLIQPLRTFILSKKDEPFIFFTGAQIDDNLPQTPGLDHHCLATTKKSFISEGMILAIGSILGSPFSFSNEFNNQLVHQVRPIESKKDSLTSLGSVEPLDYHQEVGFSKSKPDYLTLLGLKHGNQAENAYTKLLFNSDIISRLSPEHLDILEKPYFILNLTPAFQLTEIPTPAGLIQKQGNGHYEICYMANSKIDIAAPPEYHTKAQKALQALSDITKHNNSVQFLIQKGDVLIINNKQTLHARTAFKPDFSKPDTLRWLQRIYIKQ